MSEPRPAADATVRIAPSLLSADFAQLDRQIALVEQAGADLLHLDIMDGHFVPNLSFGVPVVASVARCTPLPLDVHLMISEPGRYAAAFVKAGASGITFHIEVVERAPEIVKCIRDLGVRVGVALNPDTPADTIHEIISEVDLVLVMTVQPGFGGQRFRQDCMAKVRSIAEQLGPAQWLEVDGGIDADTAAIACAAGADTFVAGNAIYGAADPAEALKRIRRSARTSVARELER